MTKEMYEDLLTRLQISELNTLTKEEEQDKHIVELEKEVAELKTRLKEHESIGNAQFWKNVWLWKTKADQLTKAKEIIKEYISILKGNTKTWKITQEKAEQFLEEIKEND